jgi:Xaa-Pro dipeptidase
MTSSTSNLTISEEEFAQRRDTAMKISKDEGVDAMLIWSRGGNTVEAYGDVLYLSNFHSLFPVVPDRAGWVSRGHAALLLTHFHQPILITDYMDDPDNRVKINDIRVSPDIATTTAELLKGMGLNDKRIGLAGGASFLSSAERKMRAIGGDLNLIPVDHILENIRSIKSETELNLLRHAAKIGSMWMSTTISSLAEGVTEAEAVGEGLKFLASNGGVQQDIAIASGPNSIHYFGSSGVPHWNSTRKLRKGDIVHCDQWGAVNAYYTDFARSSIVGRVASNDQLEVLEGSVGVVEFIISKIRVGVTLGYLYDCGRNWLKNNGFSDKSDSFNKQYDCFGHHVGLGIDGPWIVEGETSIVRPNMVLAIEAIVSRPGVGGSNFEQNVIIHSDRIEVITDSCQKRWWN